MSALPISPLRRRAREIFWCFILPFHITTSGFILLNDAFLEVTTIHGSSMAPTLSPAFHATGACDMIAWDKRRPSANLRRGDVVFFSAPHTADGIAVKRIVALPGDTVMLDPRRRPTEALDGRVNVEAHNWDVWAGRVRVPEGHVWVEGDNWRKTRDSNSYGPISQALIKGKAMAVVWPLARVGLRPWEGFKSPTKVRRYPEMQTP